MTLFILIVVFVVSLFFVLGLQTSDKVSTEIEIDASSDDVWKTLTDFASYGEWNPFITRVAGELKEGETVDVSIALPFSKSLDFNLTILQIDTGYELVWKGETLGSRVLDGIHYFRIEDLGAGKVRFSQGEKFTGLLLYIVTPFIKGSVENNFNKMNLALKNRAEGVIKIDDASQLQSGSV